jgi:hypothetical protein
MQQCSSYRVSGLDCSEEVAILKKQLGGKEGVKGLSLMFLMPG